MLISITNLSSKASPRQNYSIGHVDLPMRAYNPHQLNTASKKQNPAKKRITGFHERYHAKKSNKAPHTALIILSFVSIFLLTPLAVPLEIFFITDRYINPNTNESINTNISTNIDEYDINFIIPLNFL
jgi:hypothetical protein